MMDEKATHSRTADIIRDAAFICGVCLIGVGCWWLSPALAMIVVGVVLLSLAVAGYFRRPVPAPPESDE